MNAMRRRARRRPAPPSVRLYEDVPWSEPDEVAVPAWRKIISGLELAAFIVVLGVALTFAIGVLAVLLYFLLDMLIG
jgi:hypothetical protein